MFWKIFDTMAMRFNLGLAINLVIIFFLARANGSRLMVTTDTFHEQGIEAIVFPIWIIMGIITAYRMTRPTWK